MAAVLLLVWLCSSFSALLAQNVVPLGLHGGPEYVDLVKSNRWQAVGSGSYSRDVNGWPQTDFEWVLDYRRNKPWNGPDFSGINDNAAGNYQMSFVGQATLSTSGSDSPTTATFVNQTYDSTTQVTNVTLVINSGHFTVILAFTNTSRPGMGNNTGLTDIHLYRPGYSLAAPQLFTNEFVTLVSSLKSATFRSFDTGVNSYDIWDGTQVLTNTWADRSLPTDAYWPLPSRNYGNVSGLAMPWEIYLQICFQTDTPGWFNLPVAADDEYVRNFALLLKNGNEYTKPYNPDLPFCIPQVWNFGYTQSTYNQVKAKENNITTIENYVLRVFQISSIFSEVFGASAMGNQVRIVCMWQYGTWYYMFNALIFAQTRLGGSVNDYIWGVGEAPYFGAGDPGTVPYSLLDPTGIDRLIESFYSGFGSRRQAFTSWQQLATFFGIHVVGYESGPSLYAGIEGEVARDPRMRDIVSRYYMENFFATGGQTVNYFALVSGQPYPEITVGYVLPWVQGDSVVLDASQFDIPAYKPGQLMKICSNYCWPATTIGQYDVTFTGCGSATANFGVWLDNQVVKTGIVFPQYPTFGNATVSLQISTLGFHAMALIGGGVADQPQQFLQGAGIQITLVSGKGTPVVPSAPLNLLVSSTAAGVELLWEPVSTATGYTIQKSTVSGGPYTTIGTTMNNSFVDTQVSNDNLYYYVASAQNSVGSSASSFQVQVIKVDAALPASPVVTISSGLQYGYTIGALGQIFLQWKPVQNAQYYSVERISGGTHTTLTQSQRALVYLDAGLNPGTAYTYNITAVNYLGASPATQVTATPPTTSVPGTPSSLTVNATAGVATLKWNQAIWSYPEFGELFIVEKATSSNGPWTGLQPISVNSFVDYSAGNSACYRVWGSSSRGGNSAQPSNVACF